MNDVLRILDKLLKKRGYTIKKHPKYNLLPLKNFQNSPLLKRAYDAFDKKEKTILSDDISSLNICLRTCINEKRMGHSYNKLTGVTTDQHLLKCIRSLIIAINEAVNNSQQIKLTVFDDRSDNASLKKINDLLNIAKCDWEIIETKNTGQGVRFTNTLVLLVTKIACFIFVKMIIYIHQVQ